VRQLIAVADMLIIECMESLGYVIECLVDAAYYSRCEKRTATPELREAFVYR